MNKKETRSVFSGVLALPRLRKITNGSRVPYIKCRKMEVPQNNNQHKLKMVCFHGFRSNSDFLRSRIERWGSDFTGKIDMEFPNAPYPAKGKSDIEGYFPPPYFEWFSFMHGAYTGDNVETTFNFIEDYMEKSGPFDGILGFSQGGGLAAPLVAFQQKGVMLRNHPPIKFAIVISTAKIGNPEYQYIFSQKIDCKSVHIIGEKDFMKKDSEELVECFESPVSIYHPHGHVIPRLGNASMERVISFIEEMQNNKNKECN